LNDPEWVFPDSISSRSRLTPYAGPLLMDRRHWLLFGFALACIAGLLLWIGELDLGMEESMTSPIPPAARPPAAQAPAANTQP